MELKQKTIKGVLWSSVQTWGARAVSFIIFAILSRLLTPEEFGLVALAILFISFVQTFQDQGFGAAIVQRADLEKGHLDTAFWTNLILGTALTLIGITASKFVAELFHEPQLVSIIRWLSLSFILSSLSSVQVAILRRGLAFKELALREILAIVVSGIIGVILAFLGFGVWSLVAQDLVYLFVGVAVLWSVSNWRPGLRFSKKVFFELTSFGINIVGMNILNFLNTHADDVLIGYFLGPTLLGFYTIAYKLFGTMKDLLASVTNAVAFPTFSRLQDEPERMRRAFYQALYYTSLMAFPAFIGMLIIAPELIPALFGPQWMLSIPVLQALTLIGILHSILYFHDSLIIALGKPSWRLGMTFLNAVSNVIAFAIAVPWGIVAVAVVYVIRGYLLWPIDIWMVHRLAHISVRTYFHQFFVPFLSSLAMTAIIFGLKYLIGNVVNLQLQLVIYVFAGVISYMTVVQLLAPSLRQQLLILVQLALPERYLLRIWK
jgi:O-antigen/teichoic acid export membrane protein